MFAKSVLPPFVAKPIYSIASPISADAVNVTEAVASVVEIALSALSLTVSVNKSFPFSPSSTLSSKSTHSP